MSGNEDVIAVIAAHPSQPVPVAEVRGLARKLAGDVCLLCLEMARTCYHLAIRASREGARNEGFEAEAGRYVAAVVREADASRSRFNRGGK